MTAIAPREMQKRVEALRSLPSSPAVLKPLLDLLREPPDSVQIDKVVKLVSYEKTITAQLLRIANSPLYGRAKPAESIHAAVVTLGIQRIEDILLSNCFSKMVPRDKWVVDPHVFWRHSFGCALVCREFAERIGYNDPDKAYLAGLLHDLGIIVNSLAFTDQYREVITKAVEAGRPLDEQEEETLGFTHCQSGVILAKAWALPQTIRDVIEWHHTTTLAPAGNPLIAITHLADLLCRVRNLGYGYEEWRVVDLATDPGWIDLGEHCPKLAAMDLARFTMDLDAYVVRITKLVDTIFSVN
jgi:putative nucleotidyltransferase with HDIG domain